MRKGQKMSDETKQKLREHAIKNGYKPPSNYKRGWYWSSGYKMKMAKDHPKASSRGYVYEHILVMEKHLGRFLLDGESVHHIDENRGNNKISNLILFPTKSSHAKYHFINRKKEWRNNFQS